MAAGEAPKDLIPARKLGLAMCVAIVVGNMIGSGVFLLPVDLAPLGWNSVYGWLVTIAGTLCLVFVLSRLGPGLAGTCGPFAYPAAAFGPGVGFVVAWAYWISIWVTNATLAVAVVRNLSIIWPGLASPGAGASVAVGVIWLFTLVNCRGVRVAGGVQMATTLLKLIPLAGAILIGILLLAGGAGYSAPPSSGSSGLSQINAAATLTLFAMLGFESAMVAGERVDRPERTIPRATLIGAALTGLIYLLACSAVTLLLPADQLAASHSPFALFFAIHIGPEAGALVAAFAAIAALGAINGWILLQGEIPLALAQAGLFPRWLASLNRYEIAWRMQILSTGLATLLVMVNYSRGLSGLFHFMLLVTTSVVLIFYLAGALAAAKLAREGKIATPRGFMAVAAAATAYSLWAFWGAGIEPSLWSLAMTAAGIPVYFLMRRRIGGEAPAA